MRSDHTIRANDGTRIWISCYNAKKENGKVIVVAPGVGLTHRYYHLFAYFFCQRGYSVVTFDYRGVGNSAPRHLNGFEANMHQWAAQDINAVLLFAKQQYSQREIIYIGHSIGGEIIGLAPGSQYISRMVLVSSSLSCAKLWPLKDKLRINALKILVRTTNKIFGYFPGKRLNVFGDLPNGVVTEWANWCDNPNGLFDDFPDNNYRKLTIPLLAYTFYDDWQCPPLAVKELLNHFANASITWKHLQPKDIGMKKVGHNDFFKVKMRSILWVSLLQWLNKDNHFHQEEKIITTKPV